MLRNCPDAPATMAWLSKRVPLTDERVVGGRGIRRERTYRHAAVDRRADVGQTEPRQVHELRRTLDVFLHQVEEVRSAGEELRPWVRGDRSHGRVRIARADVVKRSHSHPPAARGPAAARWRSPTSV